LKKPILTVPRNVFAYTKARGKGANDQETTYYPNKQAQMEGTYKDNQREGKWTYWYENGKSGARECM